MAKHVPSPSSDAPQGAPTPATPIVVDPDTVARVNAAMKSPDAFLRTAEIFKALSEPTRVKILYALSIGKELCVGDIAILLHTSPSNVSHQLRLLRHMKLVKFRKRGKVAYYSIDDRHVYDMLHDGLNHAEE